MVGQPRTKGERLPNLSEVLADAGTAWQRVTVPGWYSEGERTVDLCSGTAVSRHAGLPLVPVRWVAAYKDFTLEVVRKLPDQKGFQVLPRRLVVERTFG